MDILFASQAIDGHFNPMTGVAMELLDRGHDVRWYTGPVFASKLAGMGIPLLPFNRAIEHRADNLHELYPERARLKGPRAIGFDGDKIFASNVTNFLRMSATSSATSPSTCWWRILPCSSTGLSHTSWAGKW